MPEDAEDWHVQFLSPMIHNAVFCPDTSRIKEEIGLVNLHCVYPNFVVAYDLIPIGSVIAVYDRETLKPDTSSKSFVDENGGC